MRLPTVKLTRAEWTNLVTALVAEIGADPVRDVLRRAIGTERADTLIENLEGERFSKQDNHAIVRELYAVIPGDTRDEKIDWAIERGSKCFASQERFLEVLAYVRQRVDEFEDSGGTLDHFPEPTPPPAPEQPALPDNPRIPAGTGRVQEAYFARKDYDGTFRIRFPTALAEYGGPGSYVLANGLRAGWRAFWTDEPGAKRPSYSMPASAAPAAPVTCVLHSPDGVARAYFVAGNAERWRGQLPDQVGQPPEPTPAPTNPADEFVWDPSGPTVRVVIPAWLPHWQLHLATRRKHVGLYGPDKKAGNARKAIEYILPKSAAQYAAESKAAGDDGTLLVHINTLELASPPYKSASWRIMKPLQKQMGEKDRLVGTDR